MKYEACKKCAESVGIVNVFGNILMILLKGYMGVVGGSKGLIADAIHSCADLIATITMIIGLNISAREKNERYPYGFGKAEYVVAITIYLFLFVIGMYILIDGLEAIVERHPITPSFYAAWGAVFSIAINELMFRQSLCAGSQINSPSMTAKAWESRSDVMSSIAVLIGIFGAKMGFHFMDPLAAIAVGVIIVRICILMIKESVTGLLDRSPEEHLGRIRKALAGIDFITGIKILTAREMGQEIEVEVGLRVPEDISVAQGEIIRRNVKKAIRKTTERKAAVKVMLFPVSDEV